MTTPPLSPVRLDIQGSAHYLQLSVRSVGYLLANKRLNGKRQGRKVFISVADLNAYARANHTEPVRPRSTSSQEVR